jgi:hypothetical protein
MAKEIPLDVVYIIARLVCDVDTMASLRLVHRSWSPLVEESLFSCIRLEAGTEYNLKRHQDHLEGLDLVAEYCQELHLNLETAQPITARFLVKDLELLSSKLGGRVRTLVLDNIYWDSFEHYGHLSRRKNHTIDMTNIPRLFPYVRSLTIGPGSGYSTSWLMDMVSSWTKLDVLDVRQRTAGVEGKPIALNASLSSLRLGRNDHHEMIFDSLLASPTVGTLQRLDLGVELKYESLYPVIRFLSHPHSRVKYLRLELYGIEWGGKSMSKS